MVTRTYLIVTLYLSCPILGDINEIKKRLFENRVRPSVRKLPKLLPDFQYGSSLQKFVQQARVS